MSDSFFGFSTDIPVLGGGKGGDGDELMGGFEDEIDLMNDETFGDAATADDWEEEHEKLAEVVSGAAEDLHNGHSSHPPYGATPSSLNGLQAQTSARENELEASLRQLVVEDEEDSGFGRGRAIPNRGHANNLADLFGPSSPPGLLSTGELVRGQENIWGSPARDSPLTSGKAGHFRHPPPQPPLVSSVPSTGAPMASGGKEEGLKALLQQLHRPPQPFQDPTIISTGKALSTSLPSGTAKSLFEIEQELMRNNGGSVPPPPAPAGRPRAMTVEELERELVGGPRRGSGDGPGVSYPPPPLGPHPHAQPGQVQILKRVPSPPQPPGSGPGNLPLPIGTPPRGQSFLQHHPNQPLPPAGFTRAPPPGWRSNSPVSLPGPGAGPTPSTPQDIMRRASPPGPPAMGLRLSQTPPTEHSAKTGVCSSPSPPALAVLLSSSSPSSFPLRPTSLSPPTLTPSDLRALTHELLKAQLSTATQLSLGGRGQDLGVADRGSSASPPFLANTPTQQRIPPHVPHSDPSHFRGHRGYHHGDARQQLFPGSQRPPPRGQPGYNQPGGRSRGGAYHGEGRGMSRGRGRGGPYQQQHRPPHYHHRDDHYRGGYGDEHPYSDEEGEGRRGGDPYANLMTEREKDWVIKIQLRQLQTDNPYLDDYYYTSMQLKKQAAENQRRQEQNQPSRDAKLVIPQIAAKMESKAYKPLQFEGSLGRLTASSVHNPRRIIDVSSNTLHDSDEARGREVRRFKKLLLNIEASYDTLLDVDELEKRALALPEEARGAVYEERRQKIAHMYTAFSALTQDEEAYCRLLAIRKGVKVVARLLPLLGREEAVTITGSLLRHLGALSKKEWQRDVLPVVYEHLAQVIHASDLEALVGFSEALLSNNQAGNLATALQNQFGSSVIWCLVNRGETVYATMSPVDMEVEHQQAWCEFVQRVTEAVEGVSKDCLARPTGGHYTNVGKHLERLADKRALVSVEDKLRSLMADQPQRAT